MKPRLRMLRNSITAAFIAIFSITMLFGQETDKLDETETPELRSFQLFSQIGYSGALTDKTDAHYFFGGGYRGDPLSLLLEFGGNVRAFDSYSYLSPGREFTATETRYYSMWFFNGKIEFHLMPNDTSFDLYFGTAFGGVIIFDEAIQPAYETRQVANNILWNLAPLIGVDLVKGERFALFLEGRYQIFQDFKRTRIIAAKLPGSTVDTQDAVKLNDITVSIGFRIFL